MPALAIRTALIRITCFVISAFTRRLRERYSSRLTGPSNPRGEYGKSEIGLSVARLAVQQLRIGEGDRELALPVNHGLNEGAGYEPGGPSCTEHISALGEARSPTAPTR